MKTKVTVYTVVKVEDKDRVGDGKVPTPKQLAAGLTAYWQAMQPDKDRVVKKKCKR